MSADPSSSPDYAVIGIKVFSTYKKSLISFRPGDKEWTHYLDQKPDDVIYYKHKIYTVNQLRVGDDLYYAAEVTAFPIVSSPKDKCVVDTLKIIEQQGIVEERGPWIGRRYLVESSEDFACAQVRRKRLDFNTGTSSPMGGCLMLRKRVLRIYRKGDIVVFDIVDGHNSHPQIRSKVLPLKERFKQSPELQKMYLVASPEGLLLVIRETCEKLCHPTTTGIHTFELDPSWLILFELESMESSQATRPFSTRFARLDIRQKLDEETLRFYNPKGGRFYEFEPPVPRYNCFPCLNGWVFMVDDDELSYCLLNPFLLLKINLPNLPIRKHRTGGYWRCSWPQLLTILSDDPSSAAKYIIAAKYENCFASFKSGEKTWILLQHYPASKWVDDIICYNSKFYAIYETGDILVFKFRKSHSSRPQSRWKIVEVEQFVGGTEKSYVPQNRYLLQSAGQLLVTRKSHETWDERMETTGFQVFKFYPRTRTWFELKSLGSQALFMGRNFSVSLSVSNFPECKLNCIYYIT
ncbi:hypothetical protein GIB67_033953 [Kingdonia uniflora]|uniref:KIB1-4 beta-propeller domain-containing protein n=1 Tax=Kingdonia uniflora TaxID=39325 RepID=A0A7J7L6U7_9MAGN|nr:hypothetical protein GIB67_033953 [Kingdonia uniflora]